MRQPGLSEPRSPLPRVVQLAVLFARSLDVPNGARPAAESNRMPGATRCIMSAASGRRTLRLRACPGRRAPLLRLDRGLHAAAATLGLLQPERTAVFYGTATAGDQGLIRDAAYRWPALATERRPCAPLPAPEQGRARTQQNGYLAGGHYLRDPASTRPADGAPRREAADGTCAAMASARWVLWGCSSALEALPGLCKALPDGCRELGRPHFVGGHGGYGNGDRCRASAQSPYDGV